MPVDDGHRYAVWTAEWAGGLASAVGGRGHALRVDEPPEFGGEDTGPMPTELLVAAIASASAWPWRGPRASAVSRSRICASTCAPSAPRRTAPRRLRRLGGSRPRPRPSLAPAIELAKRYCWVTNTITTPPLMRYHVGPPIG